jgi:hypothetical protein
MASELSGLLSKKPYAREFYNQVVRRPDDMLEIAAYHFSVGHKRMSSAMQGGFRKAIEKFDEYQLAKYRGEKSSVSMIDIVRLVRPAASSPNSEAITKLVRGDLRSTETWEAKLTLAGQAATNSDELMSMKASAWRDLIMNRKIGYLALVRNLRNILAQADDATIDAAAKLLVDKKMIEKSLIFPFSFITAMNELDTTSAKGRNMAKAVQQAFMLSIDNIPMLENTLVVVDNSGSMSSGSYFGSLSYAKVAAMFGILLAKRCNADIMEFGERARYIPYTDSTDVFDFVNTFQSNNKVGHSTYLSAAFKTANRAYDRIVVFSDMQSYGGSVTEAANAYRKKYNATPYIYSIDLTGYGSLQFPENKSFCIAGFTEKIFDFIGKAEVDPKVMINTVEETVAL